MNNYTISKWFQVPFLTCSHKNQVKDNLIQFDKNNRKHASLENLETFFETEGSNPFEKNTSLSKMETRFSNIFKKDR